MYNSSVLALRKVVFMGDIFNNILGNGEYSEVVVIASCVLVCTVLICLIDLIYRLFRNFWKGKS